MDSIYDRTILAEGLKVLTRTLSQYFENLETGERAVRPWKSPHDLLKVALAQMENPPKQWKEQSPLAVIEELEKQINSVLKWHTGLHSQQYMGHQVAPPVFVAGLMNAVTSVINAAPGIFEMSAWPAVCERAIVQELGGYIGWPEGYDGIVTGGGALANFTALLTARNINFAESWKDGLSPKIVIFASEDSHYCISRAAGMLGIGSNQVVKVPVDPERKMDVGALRRLIELTYKSEKLPFCVVASACATSTGSFDPIEEIADVAEEHDLWLHVDAAHGGAYLLSEKLKHRLKGIHRAHSVVWDAHKMMYVPALCTFVFYRDKKWSYATFDQQAPYLFGGESHPPLDFDSAVRTVECTKPALSQAFVTLWTSYGPSLIADIAEQTHALALKLFEILNADCDFHPLHRPQSNILCFEWRPGKEPLKDAESSALHAFVRKQILEQGRYFLVTTRFENRQTFRVTLMNPKTRVEDLLGLLTEIRSFASKFDSSTLPPT